MGRRDTNIVDGRARQRDMAGMNRVARADSHATSVAATPTISRLVVVVECYESSLSYPARRPGLVGFRR